MTELQKYTAPTAFRLISKVDINAGDLTLTLDVIKSNETIPVIITDEEFNITSYINIDSLKAETDTGYLRQMMEEMKEL